MIAERLGWQVCVLVCGMQAASAQHGAEVGHDWPPAILADVMAAVLQLVHLSIGFQVGVVLERLRGAYTRLYCVSLFLKWL